MLSSFATNSSRRKKRSVSNGLLRRAEKTVRRGGGDIICIYFLGYLSRAPEERPPTASVGLPHHSSFLFKSPADLHNLVSQVLVRSARTQDDDRTTLLACLW